MISYEITFVPNSIFQIKINLFSIWPYALYYLAESQKKKQQDDSDEYEDDESAASTSFQPQQVQPQQGYIPPMAQPGLPPVPGAPGMPPGKDSILELGTEKLTKNTNHCWNNLFLPSLGLKVLK